MYMSKSGKVVTVLCLCITEIAMEGDASTGAMKKNSSPQNNTENETALILT